MDKQEAVLSVVIVVYNVKAEYLEKCIQSVCRQTYRNLEIIIVDDGSTDGSAGICDEFAGRDSRIKVIHKENGGLVSTRKAGLKEASGMYVAFVDSDDWLEPDMYELMMKQMIDNDAEMVTSGIIREYGNNSLIELDHIKARVYEREELTEYVMNHIIDTENFYSVNLAIHIMSKIYLTEKIRNAYGQIPDEVCFGEDFTSLFLYLSECRKAVVMDKAFYHYRIHAASITGKLSSTEFYRIKRLYQFWKGQTDLSIECRNQIHHLMFYGLIITGIPEEIIRSKTEKLWLYSKVPKNSRIVLYGSGKYGTKLYHMLEETEYCKVVLWADRRVQKDDNGILRPITEIRNVNYDYIIISVLKAAVKEEMRQNLLDLGVDGEKVAEIDTNVVNNLNLDEIFNI